MKQLQKHVLQFQFFERFPPSKVIMIPTTLGTLWLCQHSFGTWPIYSGFTHENHETWWTSVVMWLFTRIIFANHIVSNIGYVVDWLIYPLIVEVPHINQSTRVFYSLVPAWMSIPLLGALVKKIHIPSPVSSHMYTINIIYIYDYKYIYMQLQRCICIYIYICICRHM